MRKLKFMQRDIITSTITWHLGLEGSNNFGEYTSFSPFTLGLYALRKKLMLRENIEVTIKRKFSFGVKVKM